MVIPAHPFANIRNFSRPPNKTREKKHKVVKTTNAPEKSHSSPRRLTCSCHVPVPCHVRPLPYGLHLGVLAWYILRQKIKYMPDLWWSEHTYLIERREGAVASLPWGRALGGWCLFGSFSLRQSARLCRLLPKGRKKWTITEDASAV